MMIGRRASSITVAYNRPKIAPMGTVVSIHIAAEDRAALRPLKEAELVAGRGIVGDRYWARASRLPKNEVTLVEAEQIEQFNAASGLDIAAADTRRNIVTRGVSLNDLVDKEFMVGEARVRGMELCEPCGYMAGELVTKYSITTLPAPEIIAKLTHCAGLRAQIVEGGMVRVGDVIGTLEDSPPSRTRAV